MNQPALEQMFAYNEKNKSTYFVTTGATYNDQHYLTTPVIIGKYDTTDVTLRKKYKKEGKLNKDYFISDGKVLVSEMFLKKHNIKPIPKDKLVRNSITKEKHLGAKFPYINGKTSKDRRIEQLMHNDPISYNKYRIISELKNMHWDHFITISTTGKFMDQNMWDQAMLEFADLLALRTRTLGIKIAYSTEISVDIRHKRITKYDSSHRHIHLFLNTAGVSIINKDLKNTFLTAMGYSKFNRYEYVCDTFTKDLYGENYILKTYKGEADCFSLCVPDQSLFKS